MNENHRDWHRFAALCREHGYDPRQVAEGLTVVTGALQSFARWAVSVVAKMQEHRGQEGK
jgi:hypothetical protein